MKKILVVVLIIFILTSILTISFTLQASQNFQDFEDDNGDDDDDTVLPSLRIASSNAEMIPGYSSLALLGIWIISIIELIYIKDKRKE